MLNLEAFCGIFAFDKWSCNTNGRQAIFFRGGNEARYQTQMIDHGFCFNAGRVELSGCPVAGFVYAAQGVCRRARPAIV